MTLDDFSTLAVQVPGVARAVAYGQVYSSVSVRIAPVGGRSTTAPESMATQRSAVAAYLSERVLIGSHVFVEDVYQNGSQGWEDVVVDLDIYVLNGYGRAQTVDLVRGEIERIFSFDNVDFGQRLSIGQVYRAATNVEGVDYVDLKTLYGSSNTSSTRTNIVTPPRRIPRIRPEASSGTAITTEYGLSATGYGGLINT